MPYKEGSSVGEPYAGSVQKRQLHLRVNLEPQQEGVEQRGIPRGRGQDLTQNRKPSWLYDGGCFGWYHPISSWLCYFSYSLSLSFAYTLECDLDLDLHYITYWLSDWRLIFHLTSLWLCYFSYSLSLSFEYTLECDLDLWPTYCDLVTYIWPLAWHSCDFVIYCPHCYLDKFCSVTLTFDLDLHLSM